MKSGYSLANSFYKILQHLRSPSKDMAEASSPVTRNNESFQLPKQNGQLDPNFPQAAKKGGSSKKSPNVGTNGARSKMTKQSFSSKALRNSTDEKTTDAAKSIVCNGKAKDISAFAR